MEVYRVVSVARRLLSDCTDPEVDLAGFQSVHIDAIHGGGERRWEVE